MMMAARSKARVRTLGEYLAVRRARAREVSQGARSSRVLRRQAVPWHSQAPPSNSRASVSLTHAHATWPPRQVVWGARAPLLCYSLMVVGYALYLLVGFNFIMGSTVRMKQARLTFEFDF